MSVMRVLERGDHVADWASHDKRMRMHVPRDYLVVGQEIIAFLPFVTSPTRREIVPGRPHRGAGKPERQQRSKHLHVSLP